MHIVIFCSCAAASAVAAGIFQDALEERFCRILFFCCFHQQPLIVIYTHHHAVFTLTAVVVFSVVAKTPLTDAIVIG